MVLSPPPFGFCCCVLSVEGVWSFHVGSASIGFACGGCPLVLSFGSCCLARSYSWFWGAVLCASCADGLRCGSGSGGPFPRGVCSGFVPFSCDSGFWFSVIVRLFQCSFLRGEVSCPPPLRRFPPCSGFVFSLAAPHFHWRSAAVGCLPFVCVFALLLARFGCDFPCAPSIQWVLHALFFSRSFSRGDPGRFLRR